MDIDKLKHNLEFIRDIHSANMQKRKQLLLNATKKDVDFVCECAFNILKQAVPVSQEQLQELRRPEVRRTVYKLANRSIPFN